MSYSLGQVLLSDLAQNLCSEIVQYSPCSSRLVASSSPCDTYPGPS